MKTKSKAEATRDHEHGSSPPVGSGFHAPDFAERVRRNQWKLRFDIKPQYDFIVCGSGSSRSVVARRLAENANVSVLLLEAGGDDDVPSVMEVGQCFLNLGSERDWSFRAQPNPDLNGRSIPLNMGKVLGGGSSINMMMWARGHKTGEGGASIMDVRVRDGKRPSIFRASTFPDMDRPNLTGLSHALVTRVTFEGTRATGVECIYDGTTHRIGAGREVVLSLGAIHTPKVLMQSGVGDQAELQRLGIPVVQHLPGVGQNFEDHFAVCCIWEYPQPLRPHNNATEATFFWKSDPGLDTPDLQALQGEIPFASAETAARFNPPTGSWTIAAGVVRPKSRGQIRLTSPNPLDPVEIEANMLSHPDDLKAAIACVELCREIGNSAPLRPFVKREVMPGNLKGTELENFIRDGAVTLWHQTCTAKMGRDPMSVVDGTLKVYGIDNLRIADGSIMPRVTTGNTMAPCVIIGERAAEVIRAAHQL